MMVELLATHDSDALKKYRPQMEKEYAYWMEGVDSLQPGQANQRVVKLDDGSVLNRYWDDRDTPRPESWLDDVNTAKNNLTDPRLRSTVICAPQRPRAGTLAPAGWTIRKSSARSTPPASCPSI